MGSSVFRRDKHSNRGTPLRPVHVHVSLHHRDLFPFFPPCSLPSDQLLEGHWRPFNSFITAANHVASSGGKLSWIYAQLGLFFVFFSSLKSPQLIGTSSRTFQQRNKKHKIFVCFFFQSHPLPLHEWE